jgi:hypothetical protein
LKTVARFGHLLFFLTGTLPSGNFRQNFKTTVVVGTVGSERLFERQIVPEKETLTSFYLF